MTAFASAFSSISRPSPGRSDKVIRPSLNSSGSLKSSSRSGRGPVVRALGAERVGAEVHRAPEPFDVERVLAEDERAQYRLHEVAHDGDAHRRALADALDTAVGEDTNQRRARPEWVGSDVCDLHEGRFYGTASPADRVAREVTAAHLNFGATSCRRISRLRVS